MGMLLRRHYQENKQDNVDLSKLKLAELKELAKQRGIDGYSKLDKDELVNLLGGNDEQTNV